jgi:hypothetical protein
MIKKKNRNISRPSIQCNPRKKPPSTNKRGNYRTYTENALYKAVNLVLIKKISANKAAQRFGVPRKTIDLYAKKSFIPSPVTASVNFAANSSSSSESDFKPSEQNMIQPSESESAPLNQVASNANSVNVNVIMVVDTHSNIVISLDINSSDSQNMDITTNIPIATAAPVGTNTLMNYYEEKLLSDFLIKCSEQHTPITKMIAGLKAAQILKLRGERFATQGGLPSRKWWCGFYNRWPELKSRKPVEMSRMRAALSETSVNNFFDDYCHILKADEIEAMVI